MRKTLAFLLACSTLLLALSGCSKEEPSSSTPASPYVDGVYRARFDTAVDGYTDYVQLTIQGGAVTVDEFDGTDSNNRLKSADSALKSAMEEQSPPNLPYKLNPGTAYQTARENLNAAGGKTDSMQFVPGAPEYGENLAVLVDAILESSAKQGLAEELTVPYYTDGKYRVSVAEFDLSGYKEYIILTISDGSPKITEFDGLDKDGKRRSDDGQIKPRVPYSQVTSALMDSFNAAKTPEGIEKVAGATESSDCFAALAAQALKNAHSGGPAEDVLNPAGSEADSLRDGVYKAEMAGFENGWKDFVTIAVQDGRVQVLELDAKNEQGSLKSADAAFAESIKKADGDALPTTAPNQYLAAIIESFYNAGGDVADMENIAGATVSTNNFKVMVGELLGANALTGDTSLRVVPLLTEAELAGDTTASQPEGAA